MNNLEICLYELELLIYYGGLMLRSNNRYEVSRADLIGWSLEEVMDFASKTEKDVLEYISDYGLADKVLKDCWTEVSEKVLGEMDRSDIRSFLRENYDPEDFVEMDWRW